jgi:peptide chain release factor subunit 1
MFNENDLRELLDCSAPDGVLSVYLNTDPSLGNADAYKLRLRNMLKKVDLKDDIEAVENYFNTEYDWSGRGIAIFSCSANNVFRAYPLAIPVHDMVQLGDFPSIKPLANLLENYSGYGVVLVDKQGARLFSFNLGELKEQEGVLGDTVKRLKRGGASSMGGRRGGGGKARAMDETIERNMRDVVDFAIHFFEENDVRRILIGGTEDNVALFRSYLPKAWQSLVVGSLAIPMTASHSEVLDKALEVGQEADKKREEYVMGTLTTNAARGQGAVIGLQETLSALDSGRVKTLVLVENYHEPGYSCRGCNFLTTNPEEGCNGCGDVVEPVPDVVEAAIAITLRSGGEVELIHRAPTLDGEQKIGAILRY